LVFVSLDAVNHGGPERDDRVKRTFKPIAALIEELHVYGHMGALLSGVKRTLVMRMHQENEGIAWLLTSARANKEHQ
jgi:hypothetical protein